MLCCHIHIVEQRLIDQTLVIARLLVQSTDFATGKVLLAGHSAQNKLPAVNWHLILTYRLCLDSWEELASSVNTHEAHTDGAVLACGTSFK